MGYRYRHMPKLLAIAALGLAIPSSSAAAVSPYEPNDTLPSAAGPLLNGQAYDASLESPSDRDFFYFYVASAPSARTALTIENLGGGSLDSDVNLSILDSAATPIGGMAFVREGESRTATLELAPQKYFIEVVQNQGSGDAYQLTTGGAAGTFGAYSTIDRRCAEANADLKAADSALRRANAKLQRAVGRLRRSRYGGRHARRSARSLFRMARSRVGSRKRALAAARESLSPWCQIPR